MDKINVNGKTASPVFDFLKVGANDTSLIGWNFAKFLVKKDGTVAGRFGPKIDPMELIPQIEELLKQE
jgi:glutathione peroxidase